MGLTITGDAEIDRALADDLTIDITTTGRKSGQPRRIEIWFMSIPGDQGDPDRIFITGTPGPRDWYANVVADGRFLFHLKESVQVTLPAVARPVQDDATRRLVLTHMATEWYRGQADIDDLVARSPLVEVFFEAASPGS